MPPSSLTGARRAALAAAFGSVVAAGAAHAAGPADGILMILPTETGYSITGEVAGHDVVTVVAVLSVDKRDASGSVRTSQSREVALQPGQREQIAETTVSLGPSGTIEVNLLVKMADRVISEVHQTIRRNPEDQPKD